MYSRAILLAVCLIAAPVSAKVIGTMIPAQPLTTARLAALPQDQQTPWAAYLARSDTQARADRTALIAERDGMTALPVPPASGDAAASMPLDRDPAWYATEEARHIGHVILSFQTPAGGWGKNAPRTGATRQKGQSFVIGDDDWNYTGTFDNGATTTELRFLAKLAAATPAPDNHAFHNGVLRGLSYILNAQYPNGGWPQVWPLQGGYHDALTYNDDVTTEILALLSDIAAGKDDFAFIPQDMRDHAKSAGTRAVDVILNSQVRINGQRAAWGQQHDPLTLEPVGARNFEPAALSSSESAGLLLYLMSMDTPSPQVQAAVHAGIAWLEAAALRDVTWQRGEALTPQPGAEPLWARYYSLDTGLPIFGDRDKTIHDEVSGISDERRSGYAWYVTTPKKALKAYATWRDKHPN